MILRIASSRIVGQGDIVGRSGYFSLNLSANSVMRGRLDARRTLKSLVADLRYDSDRRCASGRRHHERRGRTDRRDTEGDQGLQPRRGRCRSDDYGRVGNSCEYFGSGQHEADDDRPAGSDDRGLYVQHHEYLRLFVQRGCQYARPGQFGIGHDRLHARRHAYGSRRRRYGRRRKQLIENDRNPTTNPIVSTA